MDTKPKNKLGDLFDSNKEDGELFDFDFGDPFAEGLPDVEQENFDVAPITMVRKETHVEEEEKKNGGQESFNQLGDFDSMPVPPLHL